MATHAATCFTTLLLMFSCASSATSQIDRGIPEMFARSTSVVEGMVERIDALCGDNGCVTTVEIVISASYKGTVRGGDVARFCTQSPMSVGSTFVFFIEKEAGSPLDKCSLRVERDGVFERFSNKVYRYMSPSSFEIARVGDRTFLTGWVEEEDFDRILIAHDAQAQQGRPSFDAALGAAIRALADFSDTCAADDSIRDDPDVTGILYGNDYTVQENAKQTIGEGSHYCYILKGKRRDGYLRVEVEITGGECTRFSAEKIGALAPAYNSAGAIDCSTATKP